MFIPKYYEDLNQLHIGTEPPRAYFVPDAEPADRRGALRSQSPRFVSLDGDWNFRYYPSIYQLDAEVHEAEAAGRKVFYEADFAAERDAGAGVYGTIPVPSTWQMQGYDHQQYTNVEYPFPFDPPFVPQDDPCGVYLRDVEYVPDASASRAFLNFEGVDSAFYVWVNGEFAGYSQVSHATSEFEVTHLLRRGRNRVAVLVLKWCDGSYLEDQDKFRMSGIFRSVYLLRRPQLGIRDYFVHTDIEDGQGSATVSVDIDFLATKQANSVNDGSGMFGDGLFADDGSGIVGSEASSGDACGAGSSSEAAACPVRVSLYDAQGALVAQSHASASGTSGSVAARAVLQVPEPKLWNAEEPNLYRLVLETFASGVAAAGVEAGGATSTPAEAITEYIGIREIHVEANVVKINGSPVKLHGVNRHDGDPLTGFAIDQRQIMRDLKLMKEHNVNAIRTSHYPNAPQYYALYDQLGFYVIAESDIEAHGIETLYGGSDAAEENEGQRWNGKIADEPRFVRPIVDRVQRNVESQKNHPSVVVWSMGNESGFGCGFEEALKWTKLRDLSRLTHYESAIHGSPRNGLDYSNLDLYSRMYPSIQTIDDYFTPEGPHGVYAQGDDGNGGLRPFFLCEFCHAMGNGPGDVEEYFDAFQRHDGMLGGCVWEWADHAIDQGRTRSGRNVYLYGGDHGEYPHQSNFCMDGLVYPDRRPHTGLKEFKNVFRPARVMSFDAAAGALRLHNYMDFVDLAEYATVSWQLLVDGRVRQAGCFAPSDQDAQAAFNGLPADVRCSVDSVYCGPVPSVPAHSEGDLVLPALRVPENGKVTLLVRYGLLNATCVLPAGFDLGFDEVSVAVEGRSNTAAQAVLAAGLGVSDSGVVTDALQEGLTGSSAALPAQTVALAPIAAEKTSSSIVLSGRGWRYVFDRRTGLVSAMASAGRQLLSHPAELNVWRAPTDNDINIKRDWMAAGYNRTYARAYTCDVEVERGGMSAKVRASVALVAPVVEPSATVQVEWSVGAAGVLNVRFDVSREAKTFPFLPRFGLRLFLPKAMDHVEYGGYGPNESYVDKHRASWYGHFASSAEGLMEHYLRPQENGSHWGCDEVCVSGGGARLAVASPRSFSFSCLPYTQEELTAKGHDFELEESDSTVLCLDYAQSGLGSNSCGPELMEQYRLDGADFGFSLTIQPQI